MNRILITLLAATLVGGMAFSQAFPDIPVNHWAGDAVEEIADLGIVIGFPDGTFRGNEAFTRYQAALVISRLLAVVDANMEAELAGVRGALQDLASDVAAQGVRLAAAESAIAGISDDVAADSARLSALEDALAALEAEMADPTALRDLQNQVASLRVAVDTAQATAEAADARAGEALDAAAMNAEAIEAVRELAMAAGESAAAAADAAEAAAASAAAAGDAASANAAAIEGVRALAQAAADAAAEADARAAAAADAAAANAAAIEDVRALAMAADAAAGAAADAAAAAATAAAEAGAAAGDAAGAAEMAGARADAAAARADAAYDLALQALAEGDANAGDIAALNRALQILSDRVDGLAAVPPVEIPEVDLSGLEAGIERNAGDIANIREFVILLRREQVALRDRVSALEAADEAMAEALSDLDDRVATLERTALQISGSISLTYNVVRFADCVADCGFDVDRVYGIGFDRDMGRSFLSTGATRANPAQELREFTAPSGFSSTLSISVIGNQAFDGTSHPRGLDAFSAVADLDFVRTPLVDVDGDPFTGYVLRVRSVTTHFDPIGSEPLEFEFGDDVDVTFTPYVFVIEDEVGYLARVGSPDFLAFLSPKLWIAYTDPANDGTTNRTAIRGTMAPSLGDAVQLSGGFSLARSAVNTLDKDDVLDDNVETLVWGLDGSVGLLGLVDLDFEYAANTEDDTSVLFVKAMVDGGSLPILNSLAGNFRDVNAGWDGIFSSPGDASDDFPFALDQTGFGVEGSLGLFILDVTAFFDNYSTAADDSVTAFGVYADVDLFVGFSVEGWFESVSVNGVTADDNDGFVRESQGYDYMDGDYETQFGVALVHDGGADNALIRNLDIEVSYRRFNEDFSGSDLEALVEYELDIGFVALQPYVGYQMFDDNRATRSQYNELIAGTGLQTSAFDFGIVKPSLVAAVNFRSTDYGAENTAGTFTATELQWSVGLVLDEFLFGEFSTLSGRYGQYTGTNVTTFATPGVGAVPGVGVDADRGGESTTTQGWEVEWDYRDLVFAYGVYSTSDTVLGERSAQQFRVSYRVDF